MFKVVTLTRFRRELAPGEARRFWAEDLAWEAQAVPTLRRYLQDHWMDDLAGHGIRALPFHGHAEAWYDDKAAYEETVQSDRWRALFDHGTNNVFDASSMVHGIVDEHVLRDGPRNGGSVKTTWTVRLREDLDTEEACCRWLADHTPLVLRTPGVVRYEQNHASRYVPQPAPGAPFCGQLHGYFNVWFQSPRALREALASLEWAEARRATSGFAAPGGVRGVRTVEHVKL
jgi:hypothetical protein